MGISCAPSIAQEIMEELFWDNSSTDVYIDNIGICSNSWEEHLHHIAAVLKILQDNGFTGNLSKCEWAMKETDWIGYWLTPIGLKPWCKKVNAILKIQPPRTQKQL